VPHLFHTTYFGLNGYHQVYKLVHEKCYTVEFAFYECREMRIPSSVGHSGYFCLLTCRGSVSVSYLMMCCYISGLFERWICYVSVTVFCLYECNVTFVRFEVLTAVAMKNAAFWDVNAVWLL
jgi:hypothetical protein